MHALLEDLRGQYERTSGKDVDDEVLISTLIWCAPQRLRTHIQLRVTDQTTYDELRELLLLFEDASQVYKPKNFLEYGGGVEYDQRPTDMEVGRIKGYKGKGKGKGEKGKSKGGHDKSNQKGQSDNAYQKGKGKGLGGGKGKGKQEGKGKQQLSKDQCRYCGHVGHWEKDCRKKQADVRNVEQTPAVSTAPTTSSSSNAGSIQRVQMVGLSSFCVLDGGETMIRTIFHDMTTTDFDDCFEVCDTQERPQQFPMCNSDFDWHSMDSDECERIFAVERSASTPHIGVHLHASLSFWVQEQISVLHPCG